MESLLNNRNALIWAFNENIDRNTKFEGNTTQQSINETKSLINYLCSQQCFDTNITELILTEYLDILDKMHVDFPIYGQSIQPHKTKEYFLLGWNGHAILLFFEKMREETTEASREVTKFYNLGLINCGEGIDIQGHNGILCNGLIIFKDITENLIINFFNYYEQFYNGSKNDNKFHDDKVYHIFYFILNFFILNTQAPIDYETLDSSKVDLYRLESQLIGSCAFTNIINLIYHIQFKQQSEKGKEQCYIQYSEWYNNSKKIIKKKFFEDILKSKDFSYYNMYQYILDTTDATKNEEYEYIVKNKIIDRISYSIVTNTESNESIINRDIFQLVEKTGGIESERWEVNSFEDRKQRTIEGIIRQKKQAPSRISEGEKYILKICSYIAEMDKRYFSIRHDFRYILQGELEGVSNYSSVGNKAAFKKGLEDELKRANEEMAKQREILIKEPVFEETFELPQRIIKEKLDDDVFNKKIPSIKKALWDSYINYNFEGICGIFEENNYSSEILDIFMNFYNIVKLPDNNFVYFYILYKINKDKLITEENFEKLRLKFLNIEGRVTDQSHNENPRVSQEYYIEFTLDNVLKSCIFLLMKKDRISTEEKYYSRDVAGYAEKKRKNIIYYNYLLFSNFPIINHYYELIVSEIINELNENIEILPDYNQSDFKLSYGNVCISIQGELKDKIFGRFLCMNTENNCKFILITNKEIPSYLLDYILFDDSSQVIPHGKKIFEKFGYYVPDVYLSKIEENCIINTLNGDIDKGYPGGFKLHNQKIILFKEQIKENLIRNISLELTFDLLRDYSIYFYLSELCGTTIEENIFNKYNENIQDYFEELIKIIPQIVYTYILKYNQVFIINKFIISFDDTYLITNSEKKYFEQKSYACILKDDIVYHSVIDFFIIKYSSYNIVIYKDEQNTIESINIIKDLTVEYDTIYFALNFYFIKDGEGFSGINKNNNSIILNYNKRYSNDILYLDSDLKVSRMSDLKKVIKYIDLPIIYRNFYNLMSNNDIGLFLYTYKTKRSTNVYFLKASNYDFIFQMYNDTIFYTIKDVNYKVHYCDDIDLFNNYGILKLEHPTAPIYDKLLCIYNYKHILKPNKSYEKDNFINNIKRDNVITEEEDLKKIPELVNYYYKIISRYNNKCIFSNIDEVNALLINCFNYNSPYLILKNIEQIKNIINNTNNTKSESILINTLFTRFTNIYSVPISLLFYNDKILNEYYYSYANIIFKKYDISLELEYSQNYEVQFYYNKLKNNIPEIIAVNRTKSIDYLYRLFFLANHLFSIKSPKATSFAGYTYYESVSYTIENYTYYVTKDGISNTYKFSYTKNIYSDTNPKYTGENLLGMFFRVGQSNSIDITVEIPQVFNYNLDYSLKVKYGEYNMENTNEFIILSKLFIPVAAFKQEVFTKNIRKATELYDYLISEDKRELFPIQELIMGSGKTTSITPYICILLLNNFLLKKILSNEVFIVMPEFLINSSFEILMKYLFPLFNNIEIIISPNKRKYNNSLIINLISDTNYKLLFLEDRIDTSNKYMIYDEVDMMANPLTCELNIPFNREKLTRIDQLYKLSNAIYNDIFKSETFWQSIENSHNNKIHNYIYNLDKPTIDKIDDCYNELIEKYFSEDKVEIRSLLDYVKENILYFLLTKQYNFDYGMPEYYYGEIDYNYKFKAIPYSAIDNPAMGSEFSDAILTYILTIFCYKIVDGEYRKIDREFIINYYEQNKDKIEDHKFFKLFDKPPYNYNLYIQNKDYYKSISKKKMSIDEDIFENILKKILTLNNTYYKCCKNISFNDLLLYKNVKNFISFTGTAYIKPPIGHITDPNFNKDTPINCSIIPPYSSVLDAVMNIICDETKLKNININIDDNMFIEDIFCCLNQYEVLIDIGAIFIKHNISSFIEEYKKLENFKEHIVYFDNGRKILNIQTNQFVDDAAITHSNAFYYFSNKNITGVDAKNIMNPKAHGLVTITNKTNLRDFSQGIFRMRNILDPDIEKQQTFDIIFNKKIRNIMIGGCDNFEKIQAVKKREKIIESLVSQQEILDRQKEKVLIKQNIFGLKKPFTSSDDNEQILYLDPMTSDYNLAVTRFNTEVKKYGSKVNIFNIDSINIIDKSNADNVGLVDKYFRLDTIIYEIKQNVVIEEAREVAREQEEADEKISQKIQQKILLLSRAMAYDHRINNKSGIIYYNLRFNSITNNQIIVDCNDTYNLLLIYDSTKNNFAIISTLVLDRFLMYNENILEYTYISLYNNSVYGKKIDDDLYGYLIRLCTKILIYISKRAVISERLNKLINRLIQYKFNEEYLFSKPPLILAYIQFHSRSNEGGSYDKYIKYKKKYLQLKKA